MPAISEPHLHDPTTNASDPIVEDAVTHQYSGLDMSAMRSIPAVSELDNTEFGMLPGQFQSFPQDFPYQEAVYQLPDTSWYAVPSDDIVYNYPRSPVHAPRPPQSKPAPRAIRLGPKKPTPEEGQRYYCPVPGCKRTVERLMQQGKRGTSRYACMERHIETHEDMELKCELCPFEEQLKKLWRRKDHLRT